MIGPVRRWLRTAGPGDRASSALRPVPTFSTLTADGWSGRPATGRVPARDRTEGPGCACGSTTGCPDPNSVNAGRGSRSLDVERCEGVGVLSARRPFSLAALGAQADHDGEPSPSRCGSTRRHSGVLGALHPRHA